jgi:hypothetical protein
MTKYRVAQLPFEGQNVILVPFDRSFGKRPQENKEQDLVKIQKSAELSGFEGQAVIIWDAGGKVAAYGPDKYKEFAEGLKWTSLRSKMNRDLECE